MKRMTKEEAYRLAMRACEETWNEKTCKQIKEALEQEPRWIPVSESEKLPKRNMACLVAVGKFNLTQMAMYSDLMGTIDHRIFYQGDYGDENFKDITQYVKAWMPLPEPYKEESEE